MWWPWHYEEWYSLIDSNDRIKIECARGHGKSWFISLAYPLWRVIRGKCEIIIVSYSEDQAKRLIRDIRITVESNPLLEAIRPSTEEIWGTDMISFRNGSIIKGLGFGTSARGPHPDAIIVDDPLKDLGGMTTEDQERAYFGVITGMAMEKTKIITVGTPVKFDDLLTKIDTNPVYTCRKYPCYKSDGEPLFPQLWSKEALKRKRLEMGSIQFAREYLLERVDPETQPFKKQYETLYGEEHSPLPTNFARIVTVCDPAYTEGDGDATAVVTVGFTHGNHAYVIEAKQVRREDPGAVVAELFKSINAHKPEVVGIEKRKGDAIRFSFDERRTREQNFNFKYVELTHGNVAKDDRTRIGGLVPRWEMRSIHVNKHQTELLRQLYEYRQDDGSKGHDDLVDALAYCFSPLLAQPNYGKRFALNEMEKEVEHTIYLPGKASAAATFQGFSDRPLSLTRGGWDKRVGDPA
jgi:hypothetical protein